MENSQKKFIAHIGLGYWGKNILRNLHESGILHTACDTDPDVIADRKKQFPDVHYTSAIEDIMRDHGVKAVTIATPAVSHYSMVKRLLLAGKDVYVEKPLALTVREGQELVDIAGKEGRVLMVGHILRYHPAVIRLKELITSGELGRIQYIYSNRLNIGKLRTEENILWSFAPHDISVILLLLEEEPVNVSAIGGDYLSRGVYDTTLTTLEFRNGVKGHIFVSWIHPYKEQKLVVVGSKSMVVFDDVSKEKLFLYPHTIEWKDGKVPVAHKADYKVVPIETGEPLKLELGHFADCVTQRKTPLTDGREGLRVLNVLEAAEKSIASSVLSTMNVQVSRPPGSSRITPLVSHAALSGVFIHPSAFVDEDTHIEEGTTIWHFTHVLKGSSLGKKCVIGQNVSIGPDVKIGDGCKLQNNVSVYKGVTLEDGVFCGPSCVFTNVYNPRAFVERKSEFLPTLVRQGATIGANATIVCGTTIGKYAMIGAGSVIKSDVPDYAVVAGVPAKRIGWACRCGEVLRFKRNNSICERCGNEYKLRKGIFTVIREDH